MQHCYVALIQQNVPKKIHFTLPITVSSRFFSFSKNVVRIKFVQLHFLWVYYWMPRFGSFYLFNLLSYSNWMLCLSYCINVKYCSGVVFLNFETLFMSYSSFIRYFNQWIFTKEKKINKTRYFFVFPNFICRSNVIAKLQKPEGSIQNIIMLLAANHILWKVNEMAFSLVLIANFCKVLNPSSFFSRWKRKKNSTLCVLFFFLLSL